MDWDGAQSSIGFWVKGDQGVWGSAGVYVGSEPNWREQNVRDKVTKSMRYKADQMHVHHTKVLAADEFNLTFW